MGEVRLLDAAVAAQVAAGEVIESPAAVVRELVDNALDAGARQIEVSLEKGGCGRIVVRDDGRGMDRADLDLAFERHATSKIRSAEDLLSVRSLGFRGEALPSVAAVARVALRTATGGAVEGWESRWSGGSHEGIEACAPSVGTCVEVEELFFNLPARRKFLGSAAAQAREVDRTLRLQALAFPEVGFRLRRDGREVWQRPAGETFAERARMVVPGENDLWTAVGDEAGIGSIEGLLSAPGQCRKGRRLQVWVLGRRAIRSELLGSALRRTYGPSCGPGESPVAVLRLQLEDSVGIDWNVHPAKQEVRFSCPRAIEEAIEAMVARVLSEGAGRRSGRRQEPGERLGPVGEAVVGQESERLWSEPGPGQSLRMREEGPDPGLAATTESGAAEFEEGSGEGGSSGRVREVREEGLVAEPSPRPLPRLPRQLCLDGSEERLGESPRRAPRVEHTPPRWLALLPPEFALLEQDGGLLIADLRSVLERLAASRFGGGRSEAQPLLMPLTVDLGPALIERLLAREERWRQTGWELEEFGGGSLLVRAVPSGWPTLEAAELPRLFEDLGRVEESWMVRQARAWARAVLAAGEVEPEAAQRWLAELWSCEQPYLSPAGRATVWWISERELARRFGRR